MHRRSRIHRLRGVIKHYPWGSRRVIAEFLGKSSPSEQPEAELWLGAHPSGPALVDLGDRWAPLDSQLQEDSEYWLGREILAGYGPRLPFLLKVLAVEQPLSLQTHPDASRAALVFEQEQHLPAGERRYTDPYAKPELVCALTHFEALCGVRSVQEIRSWLEGAGLLDLMQLGPACGGACDVRNFLARWLRGSDAERKQRVARLMDATGRSVQTDPISRRIHELAAHWPEDPGVLAPVLLHDITLAPGQALYLPAGVLHCYLSGAAIELMASSDNVVRAGLTNKPIHVEELLTVASFEPYRPPVLEPAGDDRRYPAPCSEFRLSELGSRRETLARNTPRGPSIVLCTEGRLRVEVDGDTLELERGAACVLAAGAAQDCKVVCEGRGFQAAWPRDPDAARLA